MLALSLAAALCCQNDDRAQQLDYLGLSYKANKDAFAYGSFHFEFTRGLSASLADAEAEVFSQAFKEDGFYAFDGKNARYDLVAEPGVLGAATTWTSLTMAYRLLTDGKVTLRDNMQPYHKNTTFLHGLMLSPGTDAFYKHDTFEFPLWIGDRGGGAYDLFQDLTWVKDGKVTLAGLDMDSRLGDRKVCKFSYTWKDGKRTFWIDVDRGCVPLRILEHYNPNNVDVTFIFADLEHVPSAGWLPRRRLHIIGPGAIVDRFVVTQIDTRHKPGPDVFQLDFPEPVALNDMVKKVVHPKQKSWSLLKLPASTPRGAMPLLPLPPPPEMPGEIAPTPFWVFVLAAVILAMVAGAALLLVRRIRRSASGV